ncbi:hypothetical protein HO173_012529 [Letharia columbiana]|uniref:Uncharacterized protein n=1 Tax=Letharia columbiana TaxID=112416 RepID=A0A8H6FFK8_9LECA|nr:uncharacterized protein HO173_012529 [Letharia columbiana]KAF6226039.1 hypothetical protein HO173_012529 [Letharia columbiana]
MAPSDEENTRQKAQDDANPFIAFRRFADDQMSTLMNGVFSISSLFASPSTTPRRSVQDYEKWLQEARESSQCLAREADEAGRIMDVYTRAHKEGQHAIQGDIQEPTSCDDSELRRCPYRPTEQEGLPLEKPGLNICLMDDATRSYLSLATFSLCLPSNILTAPVLGEQLPSVPIAYLLYSPYSPVRLEQQPHLCDHGAKWREAFEDLLAVQNGQELPPKCSQRMPESSVDWVRGMIDLAICKQVEDTEESSSAAGKTSEATNQDLGLLSRFTNARQPENDADEEEDADNDDLDEERDAGVTELDVYDRFFGSQRPTSQGTARAAARRFAHLQQDSSPSDTDTRNPSILSTLTTTERTTLQDGSVHTKVVLIKRFSDGREENTETVQHQNAVRQTHDAASKSIKGEDVRNTGKDRETKVNKPSGWFWS